MKSKMKKLFAATGVAGVLLAGISFHAEEPTSVPGQPCYKCGPAGEPEEDPEKRKRR